MHERTMQACQPGHPLPVGVGMGLLQPRLPCTPACRRGVNARFISTVPINLAKYSNSLLHPFCPLPPLTALGKSINFHNLQPAQFTRATLQVGPKGRPFSGSPLGPGAYGPGPHQCVIDLGPLRGGRGAAPPWPHVPPVMVPRPLCSWRPCLPAPDASQQRPSAAYPVHSWGHSVYSQVKAQQNLL